MQVNDVRTESSSTASGISYIVQCILIRFNFDKKYTFKLVNE